jgi:hypothetical protein
MMRDGPLGPCRTRGVTQRVAVQKSWGATGAGLRDSAANLPLGFCDDLAKKDRDKPSFLFSGVRPR